jgi:hypothetical protein
MTPIEQAIRLLRDRGKFVFVYSLTDAERELPEAHVRARLKVNFDKCLDAYFQSQPPLAKYQNEPDRYP